MRRPFDEDGNFVRLTRKEIEAMSSGYYGGFSWRDGASLGAKKDWVQIAITE